MMAAAGAVGGATYVDDVFSTYVYEGDGTTSHQIVNGIDLATHGGLIWGKERGNSGSHYQFDTVRGLNKRLKSNSTIAEETDTFYISVNSNGYTINKTTSVNIDGNNYASWSFRKAPGFFDVVTYTGNGVDGRSISHSLGCIPGMWMVKRTDGTGSWIVGHSRMLGGTGDDYKYHMYLNTSDDKDVNGEFTYHSPPTTTTLSLGSSSAVNGDGNSYVCYLFAGGESTAATARSVDFDGNDDLTIASDSDFSYGTGDFTWEFWAKLDDTTGTQYFMDHSDSNNGGTFHMHGDKLRYLNPTTGTGSSLYDCGGLTEGIWNHIAASRASGTTRVFVNGILRVAASDSHNYPDGKLWIARRPDGQYMTGSISNFRIVKGTAVYTSAFKPPTEPLTNITNTVLLCCNNSSTTGSTVTPGTITAAGDPTASIDSPFDDPAGFVFGENGDQGIIKCGSYIGNETTDGPEIELGWEPQWVLVKNIDNTTGVHWRLLDSMRGIVSGGNDPELEPNTDGEEDTNVNRIRLTATGFKVVTESSTHNNNGEKYIYICIRRPDGYVGKPAEAGTDVFAMDVGAESSTIPNFDANFPVDFAINRDPSISNSWETSARLMEGKYIELDQTWADAGMSNGTWDSNAGWNQNANKGSSKQSWMWKRHAGFDVVTYKGNGGSGAGGRPIAHSLGQKPQMIWIKHRGSSNYDWTVYHEGVNNGSNPEEKYLTLNEDYAQGDLSNVWNDMAPTTTHFTLGSNDRVNNGGQHFIAMLFASVDGISKLGYYSGQGTAKTISGLGFSPRFLLIKRTDTAGDWACFDTLRNWGSGNDDLIRLNVPTAQENYQWGQPEGDGFTVEETADLNTTDGKYIYYAHA